MRYIARFSPAPNPLQASCHGAGLDTLRAWASAVLSSAPVGARVVISETVEVVVKTFTKEKEDAIIETYPGLVGAATERTAAQQQEPCHETPSAIIGNAVKTGPAPK